MRVPSGVSGFDALVQGGVPKGATVLLQGPAGNEKDAVLFQFVAEGLRGGAGVLVVLSSMSPARYQQDLREAGVDVDRAVQENRLKFVDWFTHNETPVQDVEQDGTVFRASIDLKDVGIAISRAIAALPREVEKRAAVELLSPALRAYDLSLVYGFAGSTKLKLERFGFTSFFVLEKELHDAQTISSTQPLFDGVVDIERTRDGDHPLRRIAVLSLKGTAVESKYTPIEFGPDNRLYVPSESARRLSLLHQAELLKANPNDPKLWLAAARNLREMGHLEQASRSVESALEIDSNYSEAWGVKAEILEALGKQAEAEEARTHATPSPPPPPQPLDTSARLLAFAEQRLQDNPEDPDALFVKATTRAKEKDLEGAVALLEKLAQIDETYPGLWVLKTMLHAKLGQLDEAQESRVRRIEIETRLRGADQEDVARARPEPEPARFCASCRSELLEFESVCPRCGAPIESPKVIPASPTEPPGDASALAPQESITRPNIPLRPERTPRGLTNGLVRETPRGTGMTNGLAKGMTNGLAGGTRTGGMTNGLAKGMTNGLASGMTNGLASGLHSLRTGMTNGLTNGSGFTNGLGSARHQREAAGRRWKLYLIPIVCATLLVAPFLGPADGGRLPITIDGAFADWSGVPLLASAPAPPMPPNVDLVRVGVTDNVAYLAFYFEVAGSALAGGGAPPIMDTFRAFLDTDRNSDTGYRVAGLGADRLVEVSGSGGRVQHAQMSEWDSARDPMDWGGWIKSVYLSAAAGGSRVEAHVDWLALASEKRAMDVAFHGMAYDGATDLAEDVASTTAGSLVVTETPIVAETISGSAAPLVEFALAAEVRDVPYDSLTINLTGTAPVSVLSNLHLVDALGADLASMVPANSRVTFTFPPRIVAPGTTDVLRIVADVSGSTSDTLGAQIDGPRDIGAGSASVSIVRIPGNRAFGYLGPIPTRAVVDGGFAEWTNTTGDATGESGVPSRIDLAESSFYLNAQRASAYFRVSGRAMDGAVVPAFPYPAPEGGTVPPADSDRDRVPDAVDPFPFDFNNDGTADVATGNDHDADGVEDYPAGPDHYLNTTIPGTFPPPYADTVVSVYIGPIHRPVVLGEDVARVFLDGDDNTSTGFRVDGVGAEYLAEIRGKHGVITSQTLSAFGGASPWDWTWTPVETVDAASDFARVEFGFDVLGRNLANNSRAYFELRDWSGTADDGGQATYRLGTRGGVRLQPLDIPGNQVLYLRDTATSETACTTNRGASSTQGGGAAKTVTLNPGQDVCWYAASTAGQSIPAGDWETLLDVYRGNEGGAIGYKSNTGACASSNVNCPKQLDWTGTGWGTPETELSTASAAIENVRVLWDTTTPSPLFWILVNTGANIHAYKCVHADSCTKEDVDPSSGNDYAVTDTVGTAPERHWDAAIEASSGEILLAYDSTAASSTNDFCHRTRTAGSSGTWSSETCTDHTSIASLGESLAYVTLQNNLGSNRIGMGAFDTSNDDFVLAVWDGSAWVNANKACSTAVTLGNGWGGTVLAEDFSDEFVAWCGNGVDSVSECEWTSAGGWVASCATFNWDQGEVGDDWTAGFTAPLPGTNEGMACAVNDLEDQYCYVWNGVAGTGGSRVPLGFSNTAGCGSTNVCLNIGFAWNPDQSGTTDGLFVGYEAISGSLWWGTFDDASDSVTFGTDFTSAGSHRWVSNYATQQFGSSENVVVVVSNSNNDVLAYQWDGSTSAPDGEQSITADTVDETYPYFDMAFAAAKLFVATGAFNIGTAVPPATVPVAVGFQPEAILFWWSGRTGSTDSAAGGNHQRGFGVALSTSDRRTICSSAEDGAAPGGYDAAARHQADEAICSINTGGGVAGLADLSSMDTTGFTMIIDTTFTADLRIHYLALGGPALTNAVTGMFSEPGATGNQDVTTVGFQPDAVILFSAMIATDPAVSQADSTMMIGLAAGTGNPSDVVWAGGGQDSPVTIQTQSYHRSGESIALFDTGITQTTAHAQVSAWLSNGFRMNWNETTAGARDIHYLALKGGNYFVGDLTTSTVLDADVVETGFGFSPKASLFFSHNKAQSSFDAVQGHDEMSIGGFSSATARGAHCVIDEDAVDPSDIYLAVEHDEVYCNLSTTNTIDGLMDVQSVDSNGFTLNMDDPDPSASFVGYLAVGARVTYDVYLQIWNTATDTLSSTIGSCTAVTAQGDNVQCLLLSRPAQTLSADEVVRIRVVHSGSAGTVSIDYDDADSTGDSRATIPPFGIPEFRDIVMPVVATVVVPIVWRWTRRRGARRSKATS